MADSTNDGRGRKRSDPYLRSSVSPREMRCWAKERRWRWGVERSRPGCGGGFATNGRRAIRRMDSFANTLPSVVVGRVDGSRSKVVGYNANKGAWAGIRRVRTIRCARMPEGVCATHNEWTGIPTERLRRRPRTFLSDILPRSSERGIVERPTPLPDRRVIGGLVRNSIPNRIRRLDTGNSRRASVDGIEHAGRLAVRR